MKYACLLIAAVCFLAYASSLDGSFHYDDEHSIQRNFHIRDLGNIVEFFKDPALFSWDSTKAMYRPVLLVTYALNFAWSEFDVGTYHVVNVLIHAFNACLVWWLALLLSGRRDVALWAGLLFALHPICSEPVNYISSRSESLAALFYLAGMGLFIQGHGRGRALSIYASWIALGLGLLTKSTVITLPAVLLVCDFLLLNRRDWPTFMKLLPKRHLPYWGIAIAYVLLIRANEFLTRSLDNPVRDGWTQALTQVKAFAYYMKLLLWPTGLNVEHQFFEQKALVEPTMLVVFLFFISFLGFLYYLFNRRRDSAFFLHLWGLLVLLPTMAIPLNVLVNERRLYLSCAAFCIGLALVLCSVWLKQKRWGKVDLGSILGLVVLLAYFGQIQLRNAVWKDDFALWGDSVEKAPMMPRTHLYLGNAYKDAAITTRDKKNAVENWRRAATAYERVIELDSNNELSLRALNNLGGVYWNLGNLGVQPFTDLKAAETAYRKSVELNPNYADAWINLASIVRTHALDEKIDEELRKEKLREARNLYLKVTNELAPNHNFAYANLGVVFHDLGEFENSRKAYDYALVLNPNDAKTMKNLGNLYADMGQREMRAGRDGRQNLSRAKDYLQQAIQTATQQGDAKLQMEVQQNLQAVEKLLELAR